MVAFEIDDDVTFSANKFDEISKEKNSKIENRLPPLKSNIFRDLGLFVECFI